MPHSSNIAKAVQELRNLIVSFDDDEVFGQRDGYSELKSTLLEAEVPEVLDSHDHQLKENIYIYMKKFIYGATKSYHKSNQIRRIVMLFYCSPYVKFIYPDFELHYWPHLMNIDLRHPDLDLFDILINRSCQIKAADVYKADVTKSNWLSTKILLNNVRLNDGYITRTISDLFKKSVTPRHFRGLLSANNDFTNDNYLIELILQLNIDKAEYLSYNNPKIKKYLSSKSSIKAGDFSICKSLNLMNTNFKNAFQVNTLTCSSIPKLNSSLKIRNQISFLQILNSSILILWVQTDHRIVCLHPFYFNLVTLTSLKQLDDKLRLNFDVKQTHIKSETIINNTISPDFPTTTSIEIYMTLARPKLITSVVHYLAHTMKNFGFSDGDFKKYKSSIAMMKSPGDSDYLSETAFVNAGMIDRLNDDTLVKAHPPIPSPGKIPGGPITLPMASPEPEPSNATQESNKRAVEGQSVVDGRIAEVNSVEKQTVNTPNGENQDQITDNRVPDSIPVKPQPQTPTVRANSRLPGSSNPSITPLSTSPTSSSVPANQLHKLTKSGSNTPTVTKSPLTYAYNAITGITTKLIGSPTITQNQSFVALPASEKVYPQEPFQSEISQPSPIQKENVGNHESTQDRSASLIQKSNNVLATTPLTQYGKKKAARLASTMLEEMTSDVSEHNGKKKSKRSDGDFSKTTNSGAVQSTPAISNDSNNSNGNHTLVENKEAEDEGEEVTVIDESEFISSFNKEYGTKFSDDGIFTIVMGPKAENLIKPDVGDDEENELTDIDKDYPSRNNGNQTNYEDSLSVSPDPTTAPIQSDSTKFSDQIEQEGTMYSGGDPGLLKRSDLHSLLNKTYEGSGSGSPSSKRTSDEQMTELPVEGSSLNNIEPQQQQQSNPNRFLEPDDGDKALEIATGNDNIYNLLEHNMTLLSNSLVGKLKDLETKIEFRKQHYENDIEERFDVINKKKREFEIDLQNALNQIEVKKKNFQLDLNEQFKLIEFQHRQNLKHLQEYYKTEVEKIFKS